MSLKQQQFVDFVISRSNIKSLSILTFFKKEIYCQFFENHQWSEEQADTLKQECAEQVEAAVKEYTNKTKAPATDMFDYLYAELPDALLDQRDEVEAAQ